MKNFVMVLILYALAVLAWLVIYKLNPFYREKKLPSNLPEGIRHS